ncbi:MAG: NUDIX hydrolase [Sneathiellaceae bacterium]
MSGEPKRPRAEPLWERPPGGVPNPVRPRDAASLILLRQVRGAWQVLMGRRARGHRFVPDYYVFPGGRVDRADRLWPALQPLRPDVAEAVGRHTRTPGRASALAVAAARETMEETGLVLGKGSGPAYRPDLSPLTYYYRAITPPESPIRFHARFFLAPADAATGRLGGSGELEDLAWIDVEEALRRPLVDVTEFMLHRLAGQLVSQPESVWQQHRQVPLFGYVRGAPRIRESR